MDKKLEIILVVLIIILVIVLISLFILFINYRKNLLKGKKAQKELLQVSKKYEELIEKHTVLQSTYDLLYDQYLTLDKVKERLHKLAYTDEMTGIPNRYYLIEQIDNVYATLRKGEKFALLHIDIDNFKTTTNLIGHSYGDELLLDVSHRLKEATDDNDIVVRNVGDEFLILCQNLGEMDDLDSKVKKIFKVFSYPFEINSKEISITISMGIAIAPDYAKNASSLLEKCYLAMYEAKGNGKNTFHYYSEQIDEKISNDVLMQSQLAKALANDELVMYCQPVVANGTQEIISYESLVRWKHPKDGLILPKQFLEVAYSTGQIADIDEMILAKTCQLQKNMDNKGKKNLSYSVNTSFMHLAANDSISKLDEIIKDYHADPSRIILEIKESELDIEKYKELFEQINNIGIKICVDDFGKNSASINEICSLPIYMVKLHDNLINDAGFDENVKIMLASIIDVCNNFSIKCVIKGVEQPEQLEYLKELACYGLQGYAIDTPKSSNVIIK